MEFGLRHADPFGAEAMARLGHQGWHDAHARIVPAVLVESRALDSFRDRTLAHLGRIRVGGPIGPPRGAALSARTSSGNPASRRKLRGTGLAAAPLRDGEAVLEARGTRLARLSCAVGDERAERFRRRAGRWLAGRVIEVLDTAEEDLLPEVGRFEKRLGP